MSDTDFDNEVDRLVDKYTTDELKAVCKAVNDQIMHGNGAAEDVLSADLDELQDEYNVWAHALEKKIGYEGVS